MPTFVARTFISPQFREAHFQALKQGGRLPEDIAPQAEAHLQYVKGLLAQGKSICNGPVVAFTWGINVLRADSLEEAKLRQRYVDKLSQQEESIEQWQQQVKTLDQQIKQAVQQLEAFLQAL